jgi:hypothetical protein
MISFAHCHQEFIRLNSLHHIILLIVYEDHSASLNDTKALGQVSIITIIHDFFMLISS